MLFSQFVADVYLRFASLYKSQTYKSDLKPILAFFGEIEITEIKRLDVLEYKHQRMNAISRRGKLLAPATINHEMVTLKSVFRLAKEAELIKKKNNPARKVKLLQTNNARSRFLASDEEIRLMMKIRYNCWLGRIVVFALNTGMRRGEIVNLKWADVDLDNAIITVRKTKTGRDRQIPMNARVKNILLQSSQKREFVFEISRGAITDRFSSACKRAGIINMRFHDLRHTFASRLSAKGVDIVIIAELLGHATLEMAKRYTHTLESSKRRAVELLD
jgi:integrase